MGDIAKEDNTVDDTDDKDEKEDANMNNDTKNNFTVTTKENSLDPSALISVGMKFDSSD